MKTVMVTGGLGFIGSCLVKKLIKEGYFVVNVDKVTYAANFKNLSDVTDNYKFVKMDIADEHIADVISENKIDIIFNLAAETHVDRSIKYPKAFLETDILGTFNLIYYSLKCGVSKFLHCSTDEVYGPILNGKFTEDSILNPVSPYAASKACADIMINSYIKTYSFPALIVRPSNNYGISQYAEKLIPTTIARLYEGKKAIVHGEGKEVREWLCVEDCCDAIYKLSQKGKIGEIYNIGSGIRLSNISIIARIVKTLFNTEYRDYVEFVMNRPGNDARYSISSNKTKSVIGEYTNKSYKYFVDKLDETVNWYINNSWFWDKVDLDSNKYSKDYLR